MADLDMKPPAVAVDPPAPVRKISSSELYALGQDLSNLFNVYASDRRIQELKFMRNLRQYLGIYDPEIDSQLGVNRSRAYPRITRVKCISVLSRIMNLMFPGNERNWEITASPSPDMDPDDVARAVQDLLAEYQREQIQVEMSMDIVDAAVQRLADKRAEQITRLIDDQLQELGGDQTLDHIALNRKVAQSGIMYGAGFLRGPFVRKISKTSWTTSDAGFVPKQIDVYKPQFDFTTVWDTYPDMSAKTLFDGDGYFIRKVMGKAQLRKLADRPDFMGDQIKKYIRGNGQGNYKPREFETELRAMGTKANVNDMRTDPQGKYEILIWNGPVSASKLEQVGVDIPDNAKSDDIDAEIWMVDGQVIKADMNQWTKLGVDVRTLHPFVFDEDDTSPIGNGLPNVVRDSQMSVAAATRMTLDNASVTCGPNMEVNIDLMLAGQDLTAIEPYKIWYREGTGVESQYPAVRRVEIDNHLQELQGLIKLFMEFADLETFVGPATGGDVSKAPSEPMRTAAGASMVRGDAALPFKDIVRNYDTFTQSVILSLVQFNRKFNPQLAPEGEYDVIARGATSLIAKEVRGMQIDMLAQTLTPEERDHIDERKFVEARFAVRDMDNLLVPADVAKRIKEGRKQAQAAIQAQQDKMLEATIRETLASAFKDISQGQKNSAAADATTANAALAILEHGQEDNAGSNSGASKNSH